VSTPLRRVAKNSPK